MSILPALSRSASSLILLSGAAARTLVVAPDGDDGAAGTDSTPLRSISRAAELAQPGDTVRVMAGVYRERVAPPRERFHRCTPPNSARQSP